MRHRVGHRKLGRKTAHRTALFRNMAAALIDHGRIETTVHKAKELRKFAEKLITIGKDDSLAARRHAYDLLRNREAVVKLFQVIAPAFKVRNGGYTRIIRTANRVGDNAEMAFIEYLGEDLKKVSDQAKAFAERPLKGRFRLRAEKAAAKAALEAQSQDEKVSDEVKKIQADKPEKSEKAAKKVTKPKAAKSSAAKSTSKKKTTIKKDQ